MKKNLDLSLLAALRSYLLLILWEKQCFFSLKIFNKNSSVRIPENQSWLIDTWRLLKPSSTAALPDTASSCLGLEGVEWKSVGSRSETGYMKQSRINVLSPTSLAFSAFLKRFAHHDLLGAWDFPRRKGTINWRDWKKERERGKEWCH